MKWLRDIREDHREPRRFDRFWKETAGLICCCNAPCPCTSPPYPYYKFTFPTRANGGTAEIHTTTYTAGDTFIVPSDIVWPITIECDGAGGGGGGGNGSIGGQGGGAGGQSITNYTGSVGETLTITVGAPGAGGTGGGGMPVVPGGNGGNGGSSSVSNGAGVIGSGGGGNGGDGGGNSGGGGAGGGASGDIANSGQNGSMPSGATGGAGGSGPGSAGGNGGSITAAGDIGHAGTVTITWETGSGCFDCSALGGVIVGLAPFFSAGGAFNCIWKGCVTLHDPICGGIYSSDHLDVTLQLSGSNMALTIADSGGNYSVTYTHLASTWLCNSTTANTMTLSSDSGSQCVWPNTIVVSATDSSICPTGYYGYFGYYRYGHSPGDFTFCQCRLPTSLNGAVQFADNCNFCTQDFDVTLNIDPGGSFYFGETTFVDNTHTGSPTCVARVFAYPICSSPGVLSWSGSVSFTSPLFATICQWNPSGFAPNTPGDCNGPVNVTIGMQAFTSGGIGINCPCGPLSPHGGGASLILTDG